MLSISCKTLFKKCPNCGIEWPVRQEFLVDPDLKLIGYQCNFKELTSGLLYFNHACKGTLAIDAGMFADLYAGPIFEKKATGTEECPGYCLHKDNLERCPAQCECSYIREIMQIIKHLNKRDVYKMMPEFSSHPDQPNHNWC